MSRTCSTLRRTNFYPRPPRGGRPLPDDVIMLTDPFLSTPSARRATKSWRHWTSCSRNFYPRPPRGGRQERVIQGLSEWIFLSTPSARRATLNGRHTPLLIMVFLSTPSARRATMQLADAVMPATFLSTPSARRATSLTSPLVRVRQFLSTPSARRATLRYWRPRRIQQISIHALREEGDGSPPFSGA